MNLLATLLIFCLTLCLGTTTLNAQNVMIPNIIFKSYLVGNTAINTNGDAEIQISEAIAFNGSINCSSLNITDLTGIEEFVSLTELYCFNNQISSLDVTQNTSLTTLWCHSNQISSLDLSQNISLTEFYCQINQLSSLDMSQNIALESLFCYNNQISSLNVTQNSNLITLLCNSNQLNSLDMSQNTNLIRLWSHLNPLSSLDLSQNTSLIRLDCSASQLTSLNIKNGNNTNFADFNATGNPNLNCIQVDDSTYFATNWTNIDSTATFSTNCSLFSNINTINNKINPTAYPNPSTKEITLDFGKIYQEANIQITNLTGQVVLTKTIQSSSNTTLELEGAAGVYFVNIQTEEGRAILKIIKE